MPMQTQLKPMLQQQIKMMKSLICWKTKACSSKLAAKLRYLLNSWFMLDKLLRNQLEKEPLIWSTPQLDF